MHQDLKHLYGIKLGASDGDIGHVLDFYFDDQSWTIRYLVVDTGSWLSGRQVLLTPHAFDADALTQVSTDAKALRVNLTRQQIETSPSIATHRPVSRQYEEEYHRYYGWPAYWQAGGTWGMAGSPLVLPPMAVEERPPHEHSRRDDPHLRSTKAVTGYQIQTTDGAIGSVGSFLVDGSSWTIREVLVEAGHWFAGKQIFLRPEHINRISYEDSAVFVNLSKDEIQQTAPDHVVPAVAGPR